MGGRAIFQYQLVAKLTAAEATLPSGFDDDRESVVAVDAISSELDECARRIIKHPARTPGEMRSLAEVCCWDRWGEAPLDAQAEALAAREAADFGDESPCFSGAYAT